MSAIESPLNQAHSAAANAEDWLAQGYVIKARDEHNKAAQAFLSCIDGSTDENTKRTLRLLSDKHTKHSKDLDRKIDQLRKEGKDPNLRQRPTSDIPTTSHESRSIPMQASLSRDAGGPIDESFMMLGQKRELSSSFAQFWKLLEGMLDQLSQPVAFATAPLPSHGPDAEKYASTSPLSGSTDDIFQHSTHIHPQSNTGEVKSGDGQDDDDDWEIDSGDEAMAESFFLIPNEGVRTGGKPDDYNTLLEQNSALKRKLNTALARINELDRVIKGRVEHEQQLRDSIMQTQKAISSSQIFNITQSTSRLPQSSTFGLPTSPNLASASHLNQAPSRQPTDDSQSSTRILELEEKIRLLQVQDVTNKAAIAKYKDRWERVKESMRKKKASKAAAEVKSNAIQNRIEEEVELE